MVSREISRGILLAILTVAYLVMPAYANSPLDAYIQNLALAGTDYASGKISLNDLECKVIENEYLMKKDKNVKEFLSLKSIPEIDRTFEVMYDPSSWEYGEKKASREEREKYSLKWEVLDKVTHANQEERETTVYYNLQGPLIIYFAIIESRDTRWIDVYQHPTSYNRYSNEGDAFMQDCLRNYLKPLAEEALENASQAIASAKESGFDIEGAEYLLNYAKEFFEKGNYKNAQANARDVIPLVESAKKLGEYRGLSDDEKRKQAMEGLSDRSGEKTNRSERISDEYTKDDLGSNQQFNVFLDDESNSLYYQTKIVDFNNKIQTFYENQAVGNYDFYMGIEAKLFHELMLMGDARVGEFNYGKRFGIGILKGEIKIKPFWKFYKVLSADFVRGMSAGMT